MPRTFDEVNSSCSNQIIDENKSMSDCCFPFNYPSLNIPDKSALIYEAMKLLYFNKYSSK